MKKSLIALILLAGCGGGGSDSNSSSDVSLTDCEFHIDQADVPEVIDATNAVAAEVVEAELAIEEEQTAQLDQSAVVRVTGSTIIGCGNTIQSNESTSSAQRALARIYAGDVKRVTIFRGR